MKQWFVVQTKPKQENKAELNLERQGYETYCPRVVQPRRYRGRWRKIVEPLFPRYLFAKLEQGQDDFAPIRFTLGVTSMVRFGGIPKALSSNLVDQLRRLENENQGFSMNRPQWQLGDSIEIVEGAFAGFKGLFHAESGAERVVVLLKLLGREHKVIVEQDSIQPV